MWNKPVTEGQTLHIVPLIGGIEYSQIYRSSIEQWLPGDGGEQRWGLLTKGCKFQWFAA
jgi:hypothetical protein